MSTKSLQDSMKIYEKLMSNALDIKTQGYSFYSYLDGLMTHLEIMVTREEDRISFYRLLGEGWGLVSSDTSTGKSILEGVMEEKWEEK